MFLVRLPTRRIFRKHEYRFLAHFILIFVRAGGAGLRRRMEGRAASHVFCVSVEDQLILEKGAEGLTREQG